MSWLLYFESGRILLSPVPHIEPPAIISVYDDGIDCKLAAEELIDQSHIKAWCRNVGE